MELAGQFRRAGSDAAQLFASSPLFHWTVCRWPLSSVWMEDGRTGPMVIRRLKGKSVPAQALCTGEGPCVASSAASPTLLKSLDPSAAQGCYVYLLSELYTRRPILYRRYYSAIRGRRHVGLFVRQRFLGVACRDVKFNVVAKRRIPSVRPLSCVLVCSSPLKEFSVGLVGIPTLISS